MFEVGVVWWLNSSVLVKARKRSHRLKCCIDWVKSWKCIWADCSATGKFSVWVLTGWLTNRPEICSAGAASDDGEANLFSIYFMVLFFMELEMYLTCHQQWCSTSCDDRLTTPATNSWLKVPSAVCLLNSSQRMKVIILQVLKKWRQNQQFHFRSRSQYFFLFFNLSFSGF